MQRSSTNEERRSAAACKSSRTENPSKEKISLLFMVKKRHQSEEKLTKPVKRHTGMVQGGKHQFPN